MGEVRAAVGEAVRLDKWLWYGRFFKSRSRAARLCDSRKVRVNRRLIDKPSRTVRVGDVVTFPQGARIRVVRVIALGGRRGPAVEAQGLYDDLAPERPSTGPPRVAARERGAGRPTKAQRRATDALKAGD